MVEPTDDESAQAYALVHTRVLLALVRASGRPADILDEAEASAVAALAADPEPGVSTAVGRRFVALRRLLGLV